MLVHITFMQLPGNTLLRFEERTHRYLNESSRRSVEVNDRYDDGRHQQGHY